MRNPETPRSVRQLTECPWSLSTLSGAARGCRSVQGVSVGPGVSQESPGSRSVPGVFFAGRRVARVSECPGSLRGARSLPP